VQAIKDGWSLVIFPEGGIADDHLPQMMPFKNGAFKLAKQAQVPIVMVTFLDHFHLFTDPGKILGSAGPGISRVIFHPIIELSEINKMTLEELKNHCFQTIESPLREEGLL
jgi:1-acyl-sn-glycerol-3-phosphate acyltransferase